MAIFRNRMARFAVFAGLVILALPFLPDVLLHLGGCSGSATSAVRCDYLPDALGNLFLGLYLVMAFTGLILVLPILGLLILLSGILLEIVTRWPEKR